jgi:hypothetical protein
MPGTPSGRLRLRIFKNGHAVHNIASLMPVIGLDGSNYSLVDLNATRRPSILSNGNALILGENPQSRPQIIDHVANIGWGFVQVVGANAVPAWAPKDNALAGGNGSKITIDSFDCSKSGFSG